MALLGFRPTLPAVLVATASVLWWYLKARTGLPVNTKSPSSRTGELAVLLVRGRHGRGGGPNSSIVGQG
jgi:hypothetical protein